MFRPDTQPSTISAYFRQQQQQQTIRDSLSPAGEGLNPELPFRPSSPIKIKSKRERGAEKEEEEEEDIGNQSVRQRRICHMSRKRNVTASIFFFAAPLRGWRVPDRFSDPFLEI